MLGKWLKFSLLVTLLLSPTFAFADEVVQFAATVAALYFGGPWAALAVSTAFGVYGAEQQRKAYYAAQEKARLEYNAGLKDRTITRVATEAPYRYIYGTSRVGSDIVAIFAGGDKDQYKYLVCIHAAHECEAIDEMFIAGEALGTLDANGDVTSGKFFVAHTDNIREFPIGGSVGPGAVLANDVIIYRAPITTLTFNLNRVADAGTIKVVERFYNSNGDNATGMYVYEEIPCTTVGATATLARIPVDSRNVIVTYTNSLGTSRVRVKKHLGTPTDTADASLLAEFPDKWNINAVLRGFCYTVVRLDLNQAEFQSGIPTIEPLIRGKKLYDPRTGLTAFSSNPALAVYDYLTSEMCGVPSSDLPVAQFITAANVCDESTTTSFRMWIPAIGDVPAHSQVVTGSYPKYTINGTVTSDQSQPKILEAMAQCMAGFIVSTTWDISAGKYIAPIKALSQDDIVGSLAVTPGISDADIYNGIKGQYIDPANKYVATDFIPYQNTTYLASDGRDLFSNIDFQFTNELQRVHNLCRIYTEDQRNGFTIKAEFSLKAWGLKVGQRVTFTSSFLGQTAKIYRITDKKYSPNSAVELTLKEDDASIWDYADAIVADETLNTDLPNPFDISPLASLTCNSGTNVLLLQSDGSVISRIFVEWPLATTNGVLDSGYIEVQWQNIESYDWQSIQVGGSSTQTYISPVQDGSVYVIRARCVSPYLNVKSAWIYTTHTVEGKTQPPSDVPWFNIEGDTLTWGAVTDIDLAGYVIRYHYGYNISWGDAHPLHTGILTQSPYTPESTPQGQITLMIRAIDTSGNLSASTSTIQTQFGDVLVANVVETIDFKAGGYIGNISGGSVSGGVITATSIANFYSDDLEDFYNIYGTQVFFVDYFSGLTYETLPITPSKASIGSNMTLDISLIGDAKFIEYKVSGANPMFATVTAEAFFNSVSSAPFYGVDPDYQPWPGQISAGNLQYQFRFSVSQSVVQGTIDTCNLVIDVPDITEKFNDLVISSSGTRLPITKSYNVIQNVQLTLEADGGTAFKVEVADKSSTLGPLIYCRNSSNTLVSGTVDAVIQGY